MVNPLLLLEFEQCSFEGIHFPLRNVEADIIKRVDFDRSLLNQLFTSVLQVVHVVDVLIYPTKGFSTTSSSSSEKRQDAVRSIFFCLLSTHSIELIIAVYSSCASCCYKLMSPYLISLIELRKLLTDML